MSIITLPTGLLVSSFGMGQKNYGLTFQNGDTGAVQVRFFAPPRWTAVIGMSASMKPVESARWSSLGLQLRGNINQLAQYDMKHPVPRGTLAGSPVLTSAVAVGDTTVNITTTALATLLQGDKFQLGTGQSRQLFQVVADATASAGGALTVQVEPPSRYTQTLGSAVVWNQPTCLMRLVEPNFDWTSSRFSEGNFQFNFIESWEG